MKKTHRYTINSDEKFLKILKNPMKKLTFGWRYRREAGNKKSIKSRNLVVLEPLQNTVLLKKVAFNQTTITTILRAWMSTMW